MDEGRLAERLRRRSRSALEQAIRHYTPYVSVIAWRVLGDRARREDVEEVVSDVFLALWAHAGELDPDQGLRPWLGAVARNKAADRLRRLPEAPLPLPEEAPAPRGRPEEEAEQREWAALLWDAVDALEEPDRTLFLRHYYYGEKLKDVARDLGLKLSTAKSRLHRGRKLLRAQLTEGGVGYEERL